MATKKWYSDFWSGLTEVLGALWYAFIQFTKVSEWDWEAIGVLVGVVLTGFTVAGIMLGAVSLLHYFGVF